MSLEKILSKGKKFLVGTLIVANLTGLYTCDKNPVDNNQDIEEEPKKEFIVEETNSNGQASFEDEISINVIDNSTGEGVEGINVGILTNAEYGVVTSMDGEGRYFPSIKFLNEVNNDTIFLQDIAEGYSVQNLSLEEQNVCFKFFKDNLESESLSKFTSEGCSPYKFTYSGEQEAYGYLLIDGLMNMLGVGVAMTLAGEVASLSDLIEEESLQDYILNNNWDHYLFIGSSMFGADLDENMLPKILITVPSNKPSLTLDEILIEEDNFHFETVISDEHRYENQVNPDYAIDRTIPCRGTNNNDLKLKFSFRNSDEEIIFQDSAYYNLSVEASYRFSHDVPISSSEIYSLGIELFDDTRFKDEYDDSGTNKTEIDTVFSIPSVPEFNLVWSRSFPHVVYLGDDPFTDDFYITHKDNLSYSENYFFIGGSFADRAEEDPTDATWRSSITRYNLSNNQIDFIKYNLPQKVFDEYDPSFAVKGDRIYSPSLDSNEILEYIISGEEFYLNDSFVSPLENSIKISKKGDNFILANNEGNVIETNSSFDSILAGPFEFQYVSKDFAFKDNKVYSLMPYFPEEANQVEVYTSNFDSLGSYNFGTGRMFGGISFDEEGYFWSSEHGWLDEKLYKYEIID